MIATDMPRGSALDALIQLAWELTPMPSSRDFPVALVANRETCEPANPTWPVRGPGVNDRAVLAAMTKQFTDLV